MERPSRVKDCDRACLAGIMDGYMNAVYQHDPKAVPPLSVDVRMTENTGRMDVGEGVLWRSKVEPTSFKIVTADPVTGQVAKQARLLIQERSALVAVRLKVDRGKISEIEQLYDRDINDAAIPLLTTPRPGLVTDIPAAERTSREVLAYAANSYFDALEGDDGKIAAFTDDCVRHENGYQTVNNPSPGGRMMPAPPLPNPVHDGTRRGAPADAPPGMLQNAMIVESFGIRGGKIHEGEAMPFITIPYGLGDGWTPGSGR